MSIFFQCLNIDRFVILSVIVSSLALSGCKSSSDSTAQANSIQASGLVGDRENAFDPSSFQPLPSVNADPETLAARERILGANATDPSKVNIWWVGVSSFIVSLKGHVFLLDAWEIVGLHADYLPIGREELAAIKPEAIFVGHGHFDHAADVAFVAGHANSVLVAGATVCDLARSRAGEAGLINDFPCLIIGDDSTEVGLTQAVKVWQDVEPVSVIRHTHSTAEPADLAAGGRPLVYIPDVLTYPTYLNTSPQEAIAFLDTLQDDGGFGEPDGGTWAYHFKVGDFTLFWHDSTGIMSEGNPNSLAIENAIKGLPACVDIQLNAIVGFGMVTSAYRDALAYVRVADPQVALPTHHDAWAPGIGGGAASYEQAWLEAVATLDNPPEVDYLRDPDDYMTMRSYDPSAPRWASNCR